MILLLMLCSQIIPLDDEANTTLERLEIKGIVCGLPASTPFTAKDIVFSNTDTAKLRPGSVDYFDVQRIFAPTPETKFAPLLQLKGTGASFNLGGALQASYRYRDTLSAGLDIKYYGNIGSAVSFYATHRLTFAANWPDSVFDAHSWRGNERPVFAEIPDAVINIDAFKWLSLQLGRCQMQYGPVPEGGLMLSTQPWGLDHASYSLKWKKLSLTTMYAWLEQNKRMVSHRFEYVAQKWKLGLTEAVVSSDTNEVLPYILAPAAFYYFMQWNKGQDENILWSLDASLILSPFKIYGELLVDDFAYEPETGPHKIGSTIGAKWVSVFNSEIDANLDYTFITKWTYAQRHDKQNYTFRERILGDDLGPDADRTRLIFSYRPLPRLTVGLKGFYKRHGEGDVWRDFADDGAHDRESFHPPFPSGVVEHHLGSEASLKYMFWGRSFVVLKAKAVRIQNLAHQENNNVFRPLIQTDLHWEF